MKKISALPRTSPTEQPLDLDSLDGLRQLQPFEETGALVEVTVCNGKTVDAPSASGQKRIVGYDTTARENIYALVQERHGPGTKIMLRESEAHRLKILGFVCDPTDYKPLPPPEENEVQRIGPREP